MGAGIGAAQTLEETVRIAIDTHPTIQVAEANSNAAEEQVGEANADWLPSVDLRATSGHEHVNSPATRNRSSRSTLDNLEGNALGNTGGKAAINLWAHSGVLTVTQNLFRGFNTLNSVEAAKRRVNVSRALVLDARDAIGLRVVEAYLSVLRARAVVTLSIENVDIHVEVYDDNKADAGGGDQADVNQALSRLELARDRLRNLQGDLHGAEIDFLEAVGTPQADLADARSTYGPSSGGYGQRRSGGHAGQSDRPRRSGKYGSGPGRRSGDEIALHAHPRSRIRADPRGRYGWRSRPDA